MSKEKQTGKIDTGGKSFSEVLKQISRANPDKVRERIKQGDNKPPAKSKE